MDSPRRITVDRKRSGKRSYGEKLSSVKKPRINLPDVPCPKRFMFLKNGSWNDFSPEASTCLREAYLSGKHLVEIVLNCYLYLVNFVQMVQVDVQSGCKRSISWVDDLGHVKSPPIPFEDEGFDSKKEGKSAREASSSTSTVTDITSAGMSSDITSEPTGESFLDISTVLSLGIAANPLEKQVKINRMEEQVNIPGLAHEPLSNIISILEEPLVIQNSGSSKQTSDVTRESMEKQVNSSGIAAKRVQVNSLGLAGKPLEKLVNTSSSAATKQQTPNHVTSMMEADMSTVTNISSGFSRNYVPKKMSGSLENQLNVNVNLVSENMTTKPDMAPNSTVLKKLDVNDERFTAVKKVFLAGLDYGSAGTEVTGVYEVGYGSPIGLARKEAFERRIEFTRNARGDPNVKFAWYGCSNKELVGIIQHGFRPNVDSTYGVGVYLIPEKLSRLSYIGTDVDDKGEQHVLLCRVILGKSELVEAGSTMFHPSNDLFDTGVDNLVDPNKYIVWSTHMNTHILPLYITSFKMSRKSHDVMQEASSMNGKCITVDSKEKMKPKPALLSVLKDVISASDMSLVLQEYGEFEKGKLTKEEYVERIKSIVGAEKLKRSIVGAEKLKRTINGDEKLKKIYENLQKQTEDMEQVLRRNSSLLCGLLLYQNQAQAAQAQAQAQAKLMHVANRDIRTQ